MGGDEDKVKKELEWPMDKVRKTFINFFVENRRLPLRLR